MKIFITLIFALTSALFSNDEWKETFNSDIKSLRNLYSTNCQIISDSGLVQDFEKNLSEFKSKNPKIEKIETKFSIDASSTKSYEIVEFETSKAKVFSQILIFDKKVGKRELEYTQEKSKTDFDISEIAVARQNWMKMCNAHAPSQLIAQIYQPKAMYYNHKPMVIGTNAIIREYAYMRDPNYKLQLTPLYSEKINSNTVFEIGQCSGSYGGKYLIVWKKTEKWQVFLDSNI